MSLNRNSFNNISEININSTHNHFISGINEMESLNKIVNTIPEIDKNRNMKKNNSSFQLSKNHIEINGKLKKVKNNSISKIKNVIKKEETEKESLVLIKDTNNYHQLQISIINKLNNEEYKRGELIIDLIELFENCPIINKFTEQQFIKKEDLDIFIEENCDKFLFILNITNVMNIINLLWFYSKKKVDSFCEYLDKLGFYFSYVKRMKNSEFIDIVLLTRIPSNLYNYISTYADGEFKNNKMKKMAKSFSELYKKSTYDLGYCYQELTIMNILNQIDENKFLYKDDIMYYFNQNAAQKLIYYDLIYPQNKYRLSASIKSSNETRIENFKGYNKFDLCLTMLEDILIEKNHNFNYIDSKKENLNEIRLKAGVTYLFEIKTNVDDIINKFTDIEKHKLRFVESYNNVYINGKKKYDIQHSELICICNKNRIDAKRKINNNEDKLYEKDDNNQFIFSGSQIGVGIALKFKKDIKELKNENLNLKQGFDNLKQGLDNLKNENKSLNTKIADLEKTIRLMKETLYRNSLRELELTNIEPISNVIYVKKKKVVNLIHEKYSGIYNIFYTLSEYYKELNDNLLYYEISPLIGKNLENKEDQEKWKVIKDKIIEKVKKKNLASIYYEGILELFFGINHLKKNEKIDYDIFSGEEPKFKFLIGQLILFTELIENNMNIGDIELKYQASVNYIVDSCVDKDFINNVIQEKSNYQEKTKKMMSICNSENYFYYYYSN